MLKLLMVLKRPFEFIVFVPFLMIVLLSTLAEIDSLDALSDSSVLILLTYTMPLSWVLMSVARVKRLKIADLTPSVSLDKAVGDLTSGTLIGTTIIYKDFNYSLCRSIAVLMVFIWFSSLIETVSISFFTLKFFTLIGI